MAGLGLQGAYGGRALWDDIQKMVEERQVAAKLEQDRQDAIASREYQKGHLGVMQGQLSADEERNRIGWANAQTDRLRALAPKAPEVRQVEVNVPETPAVPANKGWWGGLGATEAKPAIPARKRLDNVDPLTGKVYSSIDQGPVKEPASKGLQREDVLVNGKPTVANRDPETGKYYDANTGFLLQNVERIPPQGPQPRDPGIQQMRDFTIAQALSSEWDKISAPLRSITTTTNKMEGAWKLAKQDPTARAQAAESMQVLFQRVLDDNAVREGEFLRSLLTQPLEAQLRGWITKLSQGGTGVDDAGMENMLNVARSFKDAIGKDLATYRQRTLDKTKQYQVDPTLVFGREDAGAGAGGASSTDVKSSPSSGKPYDSPYPPVRSKDGRIIGKIGNSAVELVPDGQGGYRIK